MYKTTMNPKTVIIVISSIFGFVVFLFITAIIQLVRKLRFVTKVLEHKEREYNQLLNTHGFVPIDTT